MKKTLTISLLTLAFLVPGAFLSAQTEKASPALDYSGFVNCDGVKTPSEKGRQNKCDFKALIDLVQKMINWLFYISIPIATVLFAYAGLLYLSGKESNINKAKAIFLAVVIGFIIMLVAWFAVSTILKWFASPDSGATSLIADK